ncbi:MAG TPA: acetyl-CoA carboxylase biotin carboxyl carrier protein [Pyrinomonadaceae bacterium]|nr:acetyl-CoA carboxylase biotin carboxyl carrier protein [Pyrinomonadaceae bacterium]
MAARKEQSEMAARASVKSVNMDELRELVALLRDNGLAELELERADFRVRLRREAIAAASPPFTETQPTVVVSAPQPAAPAPAPSPPSHPGAHATTEASQDQDLHIIASPIVGTFYRSPSPSADPFVKIGSNVEAETVVCIIEAMKLMNEIQAETSGEVVKIYVENGQPVEYGQPLFGIRA